MLIQEFALAFAFVCQCIHAIPLPHSERVSLSAVPISQPPQGWVRLGAAHPETEIKFTFFVKQQNTAEISSAFTQVSDPRHPNYKKYWSLEQIAAVAGPKEAHLSALTDWLSSHVGSVEITVNRDIVVFRAPVSSAEQMFGVVFEQFQQTKTGRVHTATLSAASIPAAVDASLDFVIGIQPTFPHEPRPRVKGPHKAKVLKEGASCLSDQAVPPCLHKVYGTQDVTATSTNGSQLVASFLSQYFLESDLSQFQREYRLPSNPVAKVVGSNPGPAGDEASLDVQYITGMGQMVTTWFAHFDDASHPFESWITWASNTTDAPWVHSLSWGEPEDEYVQQLGKAYVDRINTEFMKFGLRGRTVLFASGDSGWQKAQKFPASSPYVTSVGGTWMGDLGDDPLEVDPQTTGGFSSLPENPQPEYQKAAVTAYLSEAAATHAEQPAAHQWNASQRAVPDLSAFSSSYQIITNGGETPIGGTSASCPVSAGIFSLINDALFAAGKAPLGFLNPFLYQNADAFLDIDKGNNNGFAAVKGYDPVSGLGTWNTTTFSTLKARALAL